MASAKSDREAQIRTLFPMVKQIARRVRRMVPASDLDDLIGEGCIGLIRAVDTFDATRGPSIERYAARIVGGAMLNGVRRHDPVSERVRRELRDAERERYALASATGSLPSEIEMERRRPALRRAHVHVYRYVPLSLDGALPSGESLAGDWSADPAAVVAEKSRDEAVRTALESLPPRQRNIIRLHYFGNRSLHDISRSLAISPQRASQLHTAALTQLRGTLHVAH